MSGGRFVLCYDVRACGTTYAACVIYADTSIGLVFRVFALY